MAKASSLGQFEQLVLTAILALRDDAYGVTIHSKVQELAEPKSVSLGAIYVTLDRLEDKGLISSWMSDPTPERGGRAKRCYKLKKAGERALRESATTAKRVYDVIAQVWGEGVRLMEPTSHPPKIIETIAGLLLPRACREQVLGDLHERYVPPFQYTLDVVRTLPFAVASQIRRRSSLQSILSRCSCDLRALSGLGDLANWKSISYG